MFVMPVERGWGYFGVILGLFWGYFGVIYVMFVVGLIDLGQKKKLFEWRRVEGSL